MRTCPDCHAQVEDQVKFCENCGFRLIPDDEAPLSLSDEPTSPSLGAKLLSIKPSAPSSAPQGTCSACGYINLPGEMFCDNCGVQLAPVVSTPPPPPTPILASTEETNVANDRVSEEIPIICSFCGNPNDPHEVFCMNCGLQQTTTRASVEASPKTPTSVEIQNSGRIPGVSSEPPSSVSESHIPLVTPEAIDQYRQFGKLVVEETGAEILIPRGKSEVSIGRSDPVRSVYPDVDLTPYGGELNGVSRVHARLIIKGEDLFIEDLNSTNFTFLNRGKLQPGQQQLIHHGDQIRLGLLKLNYFSN